MQQGVVALALSTAAGFVAGLILGSITGTLELLPGLLVLIPASVGMRGMIFGAMGARLGTGIAAGVFEPTLRRGSVLGAERRGRRSSPPCSSSFYLAGMAKLVASAFGEDTISFWDLVTISVVGGVLASVVILVVTVGAVGAVVPPRVGPRRGLDADGDGDRRHGHAARALPRHLHRAQRRRERHRRRRLRAGRCSRPCSGRWCAAHATCRSAHLIEMAGVIALAPMLDIFAGACWRRTARSSKRSRAS